MSTLWYFGTSMATLRPGRGGSRPVKHVESLPIHCHTSTRQMEHATTHQQVHGQSILSFCTDSVPLHYAKIMIFWHMQMLLWGLEGMDPGIHIMYKACPSIAIHPQGKWNIPAAIIMSVRIVSQHNVVAPCQNSEILVYPRLLWGPEGLDSRI